MALPKGGWASRREEKVAYVFVLMKGRRHRQDQSRIAQKKQHDLILRVECFANALSLLLPELQQRNSD